MKSFRRPKSEKGFVRECCKHKYEQQAKPKDAAQDLRSKLRVVAQGELSPFRAQMEEKAQQTGEFTPLLNSILPDEMSVKQQMNFDLMNSSSEI